jgi:hypothetical protein
MWERRGADRVLMEKPEGKRQFGRLRLQWEDNIKISLQEEGSGGMDWIDLAQDKDRCRALVHAVMKLVHAVMKLRVPLNARNFLTEAVSFSRRTLLHGVSK